MLIGTRLRQFREQRQMSQGDIEERTGLLRSYVSRVESGCTCPSLKTLERFAEVLRVSLYQLFISVEEVPSGHSRTPRNAVKGLTRGDGEKELDAEFLRKLRNLSSRLTESDRAILLGLAKTMAIH